MFCKNAVSNWGSFLDFCIPSEGALPFARQRTTAAYNTACKGKFEREVFEREVKE